MIRRPAARASGRRWPARAGSASRRWLWRSGRLWRSARAWLTWRRAGAALAGLAVAGFVLGGLARCRVQTGLDSFLPASDPTVTELNRVGTLFGGDPIVVLLESAQPRRLLATDQLGPLVGLEGRLAALPDVAAVYGPGTLLNQIAGQTQDLLAELIGRRDGDANRALVEARAAGKSEAEAQAARQRVLTEFDARYGALIVRGLPAGLPTLRNPAFVEHVVFGPSGPRPRWRFVVPSDTAVAILVRPREGADAAAVERLVGAVRQAVSQAKLPTSRVTVSGVPAVVAALSAQVKREGPLIGAAALLAVGACFLFIPWTRRRRRLVPLATTLLAIGLTLAGFGWLGRPLSLGVVAFLSVVLGIGCYYPTYFAVRARVRTVLTVAAATSASLATLVLSPLPLVRDLGVTLSCGVLLAALLGILARRLVYRDVEENPAPTAPAPVARTVPGVTGAIRGWPSRVRRQPGPAAVFVVAVLVAGAGWGLLPRLGLESNVERFAAGLPALADAQHVTDVIGSSGELDVVLTGPDVTSPDAVSWMQRAENAVITGYGDRAHRVISLPMLLTFLGDQATPGQIDAALRLLPAYLTGAVLSLDRGTAVLSYGVRADDLSDVQLLRDQLERALPPPPAGYAVRLAGLPIVAARGQQLVSDDRVAANLLGVLAAGLVLAIGLRRRADAARAILAALLATGAGLLLLRLTGTPLSPITVALGSLTAAVGCEFTVLLAEAARRHNLALRRAVLLVTTTSVVGYAVLALSRIELVRAFGVLLAGAVILAVLASLCVVQLTVPRGGEPGAGHAASDRDWRSRQRSLPGV